VRFTCLRWIAYAVAMAGPALAQPPTLISREMPRVELSVGAGPEYGGPGGHLEREMTRLGLDHDDGMLKRPKTSPRDTIPGAFAQLHVGVTRHAMVGLLISTLASSTVGQAANGDLAHVDASVLSRALIVSYRPTPWIRIGAGPALHRRTLEFPRGEGALTREPGWGWLASADVKFFRRPLSSQHAPVFGYVTAQYRGAPAMRAPAGSLPFGGVDRRELPWPAQRIRAAHWMVGVGFGFEI
jgi:hypothetical protein